MNYPTNQLITCMSFEEYLAIDACSSSKLSKMRRSAAHVHLDEETDSTVLGSAFHCAVLEQGRFAQTYSEKPEGMSFATKEGKAWRATQDGKKILDANQSRDVFAMLQSVRGHADACNLLDARDAQFEVSGLWYEQGALCKLRADILIPSLGIVADLKSAQNASPSAFPYAVRKRGYHIQAALYLRGLRACGFNVRNFVIIAVENDAPYCAATYLLSDDAIAKGNEEIDRLLPQYLECTVKDEWPGYPEGILDLDLPQNYSEAA